LLDGQNRSADAKALTNCTLAILERQAFLVVMRRHPVLAEKLLKHLCALLRRADERMMDIGFMSLPARLAKALLRETEGADGAAAPRSKISLSQTEVANMVGSSRENVNRHLRKWQASSLVDLKDGWIVITDRDRLAQIADE